MSDISDCLFCVMLLKFLEKVVLGVKKVVRGVKKIAKWLEIKCLSPPQYLSTLLDICLESFESFLAESHLRKKLSIYLIFCFPCFHLVLFSPPPSLSRTRKQSRSNLVLLPAFAFGLGRNVYG